MLTSQQQCLKVAERWSEQVQRLAAYGFELSEARELIASAGARTEIFIKTAILPHLPPKEDLDGCINALKTVGVTKADRSPLHRLRQRPSKTISRDDETQAQNTVTTLGQDSIPCKYCLLEALSTRVTG